MLIKYCYVFLCALYCRTYKSIAEKVPYTKYDISSLCESFSGAFGHHTGTTIDLGDKKEWFYNYNFLINEAFIKQKV